MEWAVLATLPTIVAGIAIIISTVTDIKVREVPDLVSYGLVVLGLGFAIVKSIITRDATILYSLAGLAAGYAVGALLYYSGQWGGGDAKLLMGIGAALTMPWAWFSTLSLKPEVFFAMDTWTAAPLFLRFLGLLVICGAIYGLLWMLVLCIRQFSAFRKHFAQRLNELKVIRLSIWGGAGILLLLAAMTRGVTGLLLVLLAALIYCAFYLMVAVKIAEKHFMLKTIETRALTEGDWVVGGVRIGKEWIIPANTIGATKEQIAILLKRAPHLKVVVKEGVPFVPSFLAAFILALI